MLPAKRDVKTVQLFKLPVAGCWARYFLCAPADPFFSSSTCSLPQRLTYVAHQWAFFSSAFYRVWLMGSPNSRVDREGARTFIFLAAFHRVISGWMCLLTESYFSSMKVPSPGVSLGVLVTLPPSLGLGAIIKHLC